MNPTASPFDDPRLAQAQSTYQTAANNATSAQAQTISLPDMLKSALTQKFSTDNPLVQQREGDLKNYLNTTTQAPLDYTVKSAGGNSDVVYSPLQQANLINARRTTALAPLTTTNYLLGLNQGGIGNVIDATSRAAQAETAKLQGAAQTAHQSYADILNELSAKADAAYKQQQFDENVREFGINTGLRQQEINRSGASNPNLVSSSQLQGIAQDAAGGMNLQDIMSKYGTSAYLNPDDILRVYNTNSKWGPAQESQQVLQQKYGVKPTMTVDQQNRASALQPAQQAIGNVNNIDLQKSGVGTSKADTVLFKNNIPLGLGKKFINQDEQDLVSLNQQFELMKQNIVRAFQGGRMSDQDMKQALNYIPTIQNNPQTIKTNLTNLNSFINSLNGGDTYQ